MSPTDRQRNVLDAIVKLTAERGWSPSFAEVAAECDFVTFKACMGQLQDMKKKGLVTWRSGKPRTLKVITASGPENP